MTISGFMRIPQWDDEGYLPSHWGDRRLAASHPPYLVHLQDVVERLGISNRRQEILRGFLDFRAALHQAGLTTGIQLINGSFVNDKMSQEGKEPCDIDVVTLFDVPQGTTQADLVREFPGLFGEGSSSNKEQFHVDSYFVTMNSGNLWYTTKAATFWNNLWHHTEDGREKGFLAVDLAGTEDQIARQMLVEMAEEKGHDE